MLKITKITVAQAKSYYARDDHYYAQTEAISEWAGKLAADLNLNGQVKADDFEALLEGNLPNGAKLPGKGKDAANRRAGFDATFSAPKSFSVTALIQDDRLIQVHQRAVKTALSVAESRYAQDREWNRETRTVEVKQTGKFAIALFDHDTSRDLDPNLHTHAVILNGTQDSKSHYRSLYTDELYANRKLLDDVYLNELAYGARELGYEIELTNDGFELAGYHKELRDTFSQRRRAIEQHIAKELEPGTVATGRQYQQAALKTRTKKRETKRDSLIRDWEEVLKAKQLALPTVPTVAEQRDLAFSGQIQSVVAARDGIAHAEERESVFKRGKVERFALEHHCGLQSWNQLQREIAKTGELIQVDATRDRYTTQSAIDQERETVSLMQRGQGKVQSIGDRDQVKAISSNTLTMGQRAALELSVTTTDQTIAWQGVAGAGKSYALNLYRQLATEAGYSVRGFAPSAAAATVLSEEAGMPSDTVASLLNSKMQPERDAFGTGKPARSTSEIWVIDEAGLLSAKDAHALLKRATAQNARVLLVGDTKQLSAVEAGNPFKSLQQHGIAIAHLEESLRQKEERLRSAVDAISKGDLGSGFYHLDQAGSIRSVETQEARVTQIVEDYLALSPYQRSRTLIVANTNVERRSITEGIRIGLQAEGRLAADTFTMTSLKPRDWTTAQAKYAKQYDCGDVIVPTQDYRKQQLVKGQQYSVVEIDQARNRLTVEGIDGNRFELDPGKCDLKTVYQTESIAIAPGDQLRWTKNDRAEHRRNGQEFTIEGLDSRGSAIVRDKDDKTRFVDLSCRQFADYAIVSTTYAAQGKTADRVFAALDGITAKESFYVATSRARHELALYTTDVVELRQLAARSRANENASDYVNLFTYEKHNAQNQTRTSETTARRSDAAPTDDRPNRGVSIGSCAGGCLAATLQGDCRTETSTGDLNQSLDQLSQSSTLAGIEADRVCHAVADFVERRTICQNGAAITDAFESIAFHLQELERVSRALAENDRATEIRRTVTPHAAAEVTNAEIDAIVEATVAMQEEDLLTFVRALDGEATADAIDLADPIQLDSEAFSEEMDAASIDSIIEATAEIEEEDLFASILALCRESTDDPINLDPDEFSEEMDAASSDLVLISPDSTRDTAAWAAEILAIAVQWFDYYFEQGTEPDPHLKAGDREWVYTFEAQDRTYRVSRNETTGAYNVHDEDRSFDLQQKRGLTQQDIEIWREWGEAFTQLPSLDRSSEAPATSTLEAETPDAVAVNPEPLPARSPLTLPDAVQLTQADWFALIPRQQLALAAAARQHQSSEPRGYTQAEQWVGQRTQIQRQVSEAETRERVAAATLREIQAEGERSLFNPFGTTQSARSAAKSELSQATSERKRLAADLKEIDDRKAQREQQDAARQEWCRTPQTQGAQRILELIEQPEVKPQFQAVERLNQQLQQWRNLAQSAQTKTQLGAKEIVAVASAYFDGQGLPMQTRQQMQQDLTQAQQQNRGRDRGLSR